jgi:Asp-tRNA(Asn)/Glu-tRNA(Gln) amidotransferase A subunit family amidase
VGTSRTDLPTVGRENQHGTARQVWKSSHEGGGRRSKNLFGDNVTGLIERGRTLQGTDVVAAYRFADACARSVAEFFTEYDYLLTPTTALLEQD